MDLISIKGQQMTAGEREGDDLNGFQDCRNENCSRQGQNLALTGLCVPHSSTAVGSVGPGFSEQSHQ